MLSRARARPGLLCLTREPTPAPHGSQMVVLMDPSEDPEDPLRTHRSREKTFIFDVVFDQHAAQVPTPHPNTLLAQAHQAVLAREDLAGRPHP